MDIQIVLIILINVLLYHKTLSYAGICDDIPVFNQAVEMPKGWMKFWFHLHGRKYTSWKLAHYQTLTIHTINCILLYIAFGRNPTSLMAALLFSVNPVNNQCSIWLSGKGYSMNATCALLMWMFPYASPLIYMYAPYFQGPSILLFPLVFLFTAHWYFALLVPLGLWREWHRVFDKKNPNSKYNTESNAELQVIAPRKIIIMFKSLGYYFINTISARRLGFYHKYLFLHGVSKETNKDSYKLDGYFFVGVGVLYLTISTMNIGLIWFCITMIMWCNLISFNQTITNRYAYLPNIGLTIFISSLLIHFPLLFFMLMTYYITKLCRFLIFYKNEYWSIEYAVMEEPDFFYPWQNRAVHCFQNQNYHGALGNMIKCNELHPNDWKVVYNLSQIYMMLGNLKAARDFFAQAQKRNIDGREEQIKRLMDRLDKWISEIEEKAKESKTVELDLKKFDMQR